MSASLMRQPLVVALLFLPSGSLVGVLLIYPLVNGVWLSFTDASPLNRSLHFVGLANFIVSVASAARASAIDGSWSL